jgi:hypothetical protein
MLAEQGVHDVDGLLGRRAVLRSGRKAAEENQRDTRSQGTSVS